MKTKPIDYIKIKAKNKRMQVVLYETSEGEHIFIVETKTLIDRKRREILQTNNSYSVETFAILTDIFNMFLKDSNLKNKVLLRELNRDSEVKAWTSLK